MNQGLRNSCLTHRFDIHRLVQDLVEEPLDRFAGDGLGAGEHLEQHDAERVDIGGFGDLLAEHLLGRHVIRRSERKSGLGHRQAFGFGDAEIHQLRFAALRRDGRSPA